MQVVVCRSKAGHVVGPGQVAHIQRGLVTLPVAICIDLVGKVWIIVVEFPWVNSDDWA